MTHPSYGVDYGVRSFHLASIAPDGAHWVETVEVKKKRSKKALNLTREEELRSLANSLCVMVGDTGVVYIEEPVVAGVRNLRTAIQMAQTAGALAAAVPHAKFVPVASWKKGTVGKGNASKDDVSNWLSDLHPCYFDTCGADQNRVDATCIAIYGSLDAGRDSHQGP